LESNLRSIMGKKNREAVLKQGGVKTTYLVGASTEKRKSHEDPNPKQPKKCRKENGNGNFNQRNGELKQDTCFYCRGLYNNGTKGHKLTDCQKKKDDVEKGVQRKNIFDWFDANEKAKPNKRSNKAKKFGHKTEIVVENNAIISAEEIGTTSPDLSDTEDFITEKDDFQEDLEESATTTS
jgi:hypothetical protein